MGFLWSTGEGVEDIPNNADVVEDPIDGTFATSVTLALGPLSECAKPPSSRDPDAVCGWDLPSDWWSGDLRITRGDTGPVARFSVFAGDADTDFDVSMPLHEVPRSSPWRFSFSPDNAGGFWGDVEGSITRIEAERGPDFSDAAVD